MILRINKPSDKDKVCQQIQTLADKIYTIDIKQVKKNRSIPANGLYWTWLTCLMAETGNDKQDLHEYFKQRFLPMQMITIFGQTGHRSTSTKDLNSLEFAKYMTKVQVFANTELGIILPNFEDQYLEEFYSEYKDFI